MLYRKIKDYIVDFLQSNINKVLVVDGARQIGKSYIIRYIGKKQFSKYVEINLLEDLMGAKLFEHVRPSKIFIFN